jgi:hypothetical protein
MFYLFVYLTTLPVAQVIQCRKWPVNNEFEGIWKEAVAGYLME